MLRLWHALAASNAILLAGLVWTTTHSEAAAPAADVVRARLIQLVDERGQTRAEFHLGADGSGNMRLIAGNGEVRVKLGASPGGSGLMLADGRTEPGILLSADGNGPSLVLTNAAGQERRVEP